MRTATAGSSGIAAGRSLRSVLPALVRHDLHRLYGTSRGRAIWAIASPLLPVVVLGAVFSLGLRASLQGEAWFPGFTAAYVPWIVLASVATAATSAMADRRHLAKRPSFPVEAAPLSTVVLAAPALVIALGLALAACASHLEASALLALPHLVVATFVLAAGLGLVLGALGAVDHRLAVVVSPLVQVGFWLTPIAWSPTIASEPIQRLLDVLPSAHLVAGFRHALLPDVFAAPDPWTVVVFWVEAIALLLAGRSLLRRIRPHVWGSL